LDKIVSTILILTVFSSISIAEPIVLDVVYPRSGPSGVPPKMALLDSTFVFGSVKPEKSAVTVNGAEAVVYPNGAFMAWAPVDTASRQFLVIAKWGADSAVAAVPFELIIPVEAPPVKEEYPGVLEVKTPNAVLRYSANGGVYYMFPLPGTLLTAQSAAKNFYKVKLTSQQSVYVEDKFVQWRPDLALPAVRRIYSLRVEDFPQTCKIYLPGSQFNLHRVVEDTEPAAIKLYLYGLESHIDNIRYFSDYIREIRWEQIDSETLLLSIYLSDTQVWGYKAEFDARGQLVFSVHKPPRLEMKGLKIALDAGHGGDEYGAVGPTRLLEKDINLTLALNLKEQLEKKGAQVFLTRDSDKKLDLYERMEAADKWGADLFISIHNNALADGSNPFERRGMGVYYYQPHSLDLGLALHRNLLKYAPFKNDGFYYGNLAAPRTTYMPAALIECAYIMHPEDEMLLRLEKAQKAIVKGIYQGIEDFLENSAKVKNK